MNRIRKKKLLDGIILAENVEDSGAGGTWTSEISGDIVSLQKASADDDNTLEIPLSSLLESVNDETGGEIRVHGFDIVYNIGTNAIGTATSEIHKVTLASDGSQSASTVSLSGTLDKTTGDHRVSMSVDNDNGYVELDENELATIELILNASGTDVYTVDIYGIVVDYSVVEL